MDEPETASFFGKTHLSNFDPSRTKLASLVEDVVNIFLNSRSGVKNEDLYVDGDGEEIFSI